LLGHHLVPPGSERGLGVWDAQSWAAVPAARCDVRRGDFGSADHRVVAGGLSALAEAWAVARIGGDDFVLLGTGAGALVEDAMGLAEAVVAALTEPIEVATTDGDLVGVTIGASVGVAHTGVGCDVDGLHELADGALYSVKASGGSGWSAHLPT